MNGRCNHRGKWKFRLNGQCLRSGATLAFVLLALPVVTLAQTDEIQVYDAAIADQGVFNLNQVAGKAAGQFTHAVLGEKRHGERDQSGVGVAAQINEAALPRGGKGE